MKNYFKALALLFTFILLTNCEKDNITGNSEVEIKKAPFVLKRTSLSEIPDIKNFLVGNSGEDIFNKSTEIYGAIFDVDNVLEVIDTLNNTDYSFRFIYPDTPIGTFYNLVVGKTSQGDHKVPYVTKYVCDEDQLEEYISNDLDFRFFVGKIYRYKYTDFFLLGSFLKAGSTCSNDETDVNGDPIPCDNSNVNSTGTGGAANGDSTTGDGHGAYSSGSTSNSGSYTVYSGSSTGDDGGRSGMCMEKYDYFDNGRYVGTTTHWRPCDDIDDKSASLKNASSDCPECATDGNSGVNTYAKPVQKTNYYLDNVLSTSELNFLNRYTHIAEEINELLLANRNEDDSFSGEVKRLAEELIQVDVILNSEFEIKTTTRIPFELNTCCPGDCCPDPLIYEDDLIIHEYGIKPIQASVDATFNIIVGGASLLMSDDGYGRRVRSLMTSIGVQVPSDVSNEHLSRIYQIKKRDGIVIVEYRPGILGSMLDVGLTTLDLLSFLSPSKGGGAFLAIRSGGNATITAITSHLRKISVTSDKISSTIDIYKDRARFVLEGTGPNSKVKGHHPLAKSAFKSDKFYDLKKAFSVSADALGGQAVHNAITGNQNRLYTAFARKGEVLTIDKMADIEIQAMVDAGIPRDVASGWVIKALEDLSAQGVKMITNIPWNGLN